MVGLSFPREADMTSRLLRSAGAFGCAAWPSLLEFEAPQGIPDVVFPRFSAAAAGVREGTLLARPFVARSESAVVFALHERRVRGLREVATRARLAETTARATLRELAAEGAVNARGGGWVLAGPCPARLSQAVAVELKLRDWRRALGQAIRYRGFAERSFVVVAEEYAQAPASALEAFRLHGVGLASLSPWGSINVITRPRARKPLDPIARFLAGERLWAACERQSGCGGLAVAA